MYNKQTMESILLSLDDEMWQLIIQQLPRMCELNKFELCECGKNSAIHIKKHERRSLCKNAFINVEHFCNECFNRSYINHKKHASMWRSKSTYCSDCLDLVEYSQDPMKYKIINSMFSPGLFALSKRFYNIMKSLPVWADVNREYIDRGLISDVVDLPYENLKLCTNDITEVIVVVRINFLHQRIDKDEKFFHTFRKLHSMQKKIFALIEEPSYDGDTKVINSLDMSVAEAINLGNGTFVDGTELVLSKLESHQWYDRYYPTS